MVRTFETRHTVKISPDRFMALQIDESFDQAMAALEDCVLQTPTQEMSREESGEQVLKQTSHLELKSNPVPPLLRGILGSQMNELVSGKITLEQTVYPRRASEGHAKATRTLLPGSLKEVIQVESQQWIERLSDTECVLLSRHTIECTLFGIAGPIEMAIENGIRENYDKLPGKMEAFAGGGAAAVTSKGGNGAKHSGSSESDRLADPLEAARDSTVTPSSRSRQCSDVDLFCCGRRKQEKPSRARVSFAGELSPRRRESWARDRALSGNELAVGRPRVISVTAQYDEANPSAAPKLAFSAQDAYDGARGRSRTVSVTMDERHERYVVSDSEPFLGSIAWEFFGGAAEALGYGSAAAGYVLQ